jgi:hypothetical protein
MLDAKGIEVPTQHVYVLPKKNLTKRKRENLDDGENKNRELGDTSIDQATGGVEGELQKGDGDVRASPLGRKLCAKWMKNRKCLGGGRERLTRRWVVGFTLMSVSGTCFGILVLTRRMSREVLMRCVRAAYETSKYMMMVEWQDAYGDEQF